MSHLESESMTIKRLEVALKKKNWQLLEYGISKAFELIKSETQILQPQQWANIAKKAESLNPPDELVKQLGEIVEHIISISNYEPSFEDESSLEQIKVVEPALKHVDITTHVRKVIPNSGSFAIVVDSYTSNDDTNTVFNFNHALNKCLIKEVDKIDIELMNNLAKLVKNSHKRCEELEGINKFITSCNQPGSIITTGLNVEVIKILCRFNIDYTHENLMKPETANFWKLYPLAGLPSVFHCKTCNTRIFIEKAGNIVLTACPNCSGMSYPALYNVDTPGFQIHPAVWYTAYNALADANNWLLVLQSDMSNKKMVLKLIMDVYSKSNNLKNVYIVSNNTQVGEFWKNRLEKTNSKVAVGPVYFSVDLFLKNTMKLSDINAST